MVDVSSLYIHFPDIETNKLEMTKQSIQNKQTNILTNKQVNTTCSHYHDYRLSCTSWIHVDYLTYCYYVVELLSLQCTVYGFKYQWPYSYRKLTSHLLSNQVPTQSHTPWHPPPSTGPPLQPYPSQFRTTIVVKSNPDENSKYIMKPAKQTTYLLYEYNFIQLVS